MYRAFFIFQIRSHGGFSVRRGSRGGKVQGIRGINGGYKIGRRRLRIVWEMEKPKNLYVWPVDMN